MISLPESLASIIDVTNRLAAQRCELEQLRREVRKAELRILQKRCWRPAGSLLYTRAVFDGLVDHHQFVSALRRS